MASREFTEVLEMLRSGGGFEGDTNDPEVLQAMREQFDRMAASPANDIAVGAAELGGVSGEWVSAPDADSSTVLVMLHGGGYSLGSPKSHRDLASRISRAAGMPVFSVDYRLAPEHPFPAALDDVLAVYRALLASGRSPARMGITGDSAGGGLALATLAALKRDGDPLPAAAAVISPWADLACTGRSITGRKHLDPIITGEPADSAAQYLGGTDPFHPVASPVYADYHDFPPLLIQVGTAEVLFDDAARVAARACEAGVPVCFEPWPDMVHVWHVFAAIVPESQQAIDRMGAWLREHLGD